MISGIIIALMIVVSAFYILLKLNKDLQIPINELIIIVAFGIVWIPVYYIYRGLKSLISKMEGNRND